jgi:hypothetical protein
VTKEKTKARSAGDFAAAHVRSVRAPLKIKAAIAQMRSVGPEHWEYENDLTKAPYNLAQVDLSAFRDQFKEYWLETEVQNGKAARRVWFADPKVAAKFREE